MTIDHQGYQPLIAMCLEVNNQPITLPSSRKAKPARKTAPLVMVGLELQHSESLPKTTDSTFTDVQTALSPQQS